MKSILYQAMEQSPSAEVVEPEVIARYFAKFDEQFFTYCDKELAMINTFYSGTHLHLKQNSHILILFNLWFSFAEKFAEATRKYAALKSELAASKDRNKGGDKSGNRMNQLLSGSKRSGAGSGGQNQPAMKIADLKLAFSEFYLSLILLQNYQNLNFTGFRKILKKHDKVNKYINISTVILIKRY